jgi:hypothetical protein
MTEKITIVDASTYSTTFPLNKKDIADFLQKPEDAVAVDHVSLIASRVPFAPAGRPYSRFHQELKETSSHFNQAIANSPNTEFGRTVLFVGSTNFPSAYVAAAYFANGYGNPGQHLAISPNPRGNDVHFLDLSQHADLEAAARTNDNLFTFTAKGIGANKRIIIFTSVLRQPTHDTFAKLEAAYPDEESDVYAIHFKPDANPSIVTKDGGGNIANYQRLAADYETVLDFLLTRHKSEGTKFTLAFDAPSWWAYLAALVIQGKENKHGDVNVDLLDFCAGAYVVAEVGFRAPRI